MNRFEACPIAKAHHFPRSTHKSCAIYRPISVQSGMIIGALIASRVLGTSRTITITCFLVQFYRSYMPSWVRCPAIILKLWNVGNMYNEHSQYDSLIGSLICSRYFCPSHSKGFAYNCRRYPCHSSMSSYKKAFWIVILILIASMEMGNSLLQMPSS